MNGADPRGRYFATSQYSPAGAGFGDTRGFGRLWDSDAALPETAQTMPGWERGSIVRQSQPVFVLTALGPMWDLTNPAGWRPNI
ncbi:MAG TPA: hypothetical protein VGP90_05940 [Acidimicrobiia bacterium]|jgi:hypothetical protein|nr:hypothetical protein [Acidimicrobiia bacterium]